jgi:putative membrane protein
MPEEHDGRSTPATWNRARVEAELDRVVSERRFEIAVVFPVVGAIMLLASAEGWVTGPLRYNTALILFGTAVMRLPLIAGVAPLTGRRAALALGGLTAYAYLIEYVGTTTGWPYGAFEYGIDLGPMIAGKVPLGLPVFFFPLVLNSYLLCLLLLGDRARSRPVRLGTTLATVLLVDAVLDPGAVAIGFWAYIPPGPYYGVPVSNYAGWVLSGAVAVVAFDVAFDRDALLWRLHETGFMLDDLVSFVILWGGINLFYAQWVAVVVAAGLGAGLLATDRFDFSVLRDRFAGVGGSPGR